MNHLRKEGSGVYQPFLSFLPEMDRDGGSLGVLSALSSPVTRNMFHVGGDVNKFRLMGSPSQSVRGAGLAV